jgi:hypothetical protein
VRHLAPDLWQLRGPPNGIKVYLAEDMLVFTGSPACAIRPHLHLGSRRKPPLDPQPARPPTIARVRRARRTLRDIAKLERLVVNLP